ncbi:hypothetical protein AB0G06_43630 [Nonomuraea dietziae]|uniref:hypothetical protein n=1 Tax=Nonomuraea dietziae TaxID=65515 RepID=UPI0033F04525
MDVNELARQLQTLMDEQSRQAAKPEQPQDVLLVSGPKPAQPDPFYERYFAPVNDITAVQPTYQPHPYLFDDHLLEETEEAGDVKITNPANATYRAKRTGYQGLIASVLIAVGGVLTSLTIGAEIDWRLLGLSVGQAILTAVVSYLHNDKTAE